MMKSIQTELVCNSDAAGLGHPTQFSAAWNYRYFILQNELGFKGL